MLSLHCLRYYALTLCLLPAFGAADAHADNDYRLLQLSGHYVKWGESELGVGAKVSYAFVDAPMHFDDARNCGELVPLDELAINSDISLATLREQTAAAFQVWAEAADLSFHQAETVADADILIGAQGRPKGHAFANVSYLQGGSDNVRTIDQSLVCLNPNRAWKVGFDGDLDTYDLHHVLVHEIGHAIGLDHPGPSGQIMGFRYDELLNSLQAGDISGITTLYGPGTVQTLATEADDTGTRNDGDRTPGD